MVRCIPAWPRCAPFAAVLLLSLPAAAQEIPEDAVAAGEATGLLAVAADRRSSFAAGAPRVTVRLGEETRTIALADDGNPPDARAGDGVWVGLMEAPPTGESLDLVLADGSGVELWRDSVPISADLALPRVDFYVDGPYVKTTLATMSAPTAEAAAPPPGTVVDAPPPPDGGAPPPPPGMAGAALPRDATSGAGLVVAGLLGLVGLLAGVVVGLVLGRRGGGRVELEPVGGAVEHAPFGEGPPLRDARQAWVVPQGEQIPRVAEQLAAHLAATGPVVLAAEGEDRARLSERLSGTMGIVSTTEERPSADALLDAADRLRCLGRPAIVVAGPGAVEAPERGEHPDAVLVDLLLEAGDDTDVVVLVPRGNWPGIVPRASVAVGEDGALRFTVFAEEVEDEEAEPSDPVVEAVG